MRVEGQYHEFDFSSNVNSAFIIKLIIANVSRHLKHFSVPLEIRRVMRIYCIIRTQHNKSVQCACVYCIILLKILIAETI